MSRYSWLADLKATEFCFVVTLSLLEQAAGLRMPSDARGLDTDNCGRCASTSASATPAGTGAIMVRRTAFGGRWPANGTDWVSGALLEMRLVPWRVI
jgi:hypothetical protein